MPDRVQHPVAAAAPGANGPLTAAALTVPPGAPPVAVHVAPPVAPPVAIVERVVSSPVVRSGYTSAVVHVLLLTLLAVLWIDLPARSQPRPLELTFAESVAVADPAGAADGGAEGTPVVMPARSQVAMPENEAAADSEAASLSLDDAAQAGPTTVAEFATLRRIDPPRSDATTGATAAAAGERPTQAPDPIETKVPATAADREPAPGTSAGMPYASRGGAARAAALRTHGGSDASEAAVEQGLAWLALHQAADGGWRFDLSRCRCDGSCSQPGTVGSTTAATGLALLPFLGAGSTQAGGPYQETVARGLYYLLGRMRPTTRGGDLCEGTMYGQGVATLALAEAFGMTRDDLLARPLADAVRFIVTAQDTYGGGWRYLPGQSGDTTVTAWQLAALKSAALAGIEVPSPTIDGIRRFLDRVQARGGEAYGYLGSQPQPCTSAIGLFCRLHTSWNDRPRLDRGLATLARPGPAPQAVYCNFYLAQALLQADHAAWPRWNARNRDQLVALQAAVGHERGSWSFDDRETAPGGRLAHTALALLTLEVYYRVLPLYRPDAVGHEF